MQKLRAAVIASIALAFTAIAVGPAQAAITSAGCTTAGAYGNVTITNWTDPSQKVGLALELKDTAADAHHVRIRIVSQQHDGKRVNWPWRKNTGGSGTTANWTTTADDDRGLHELGVQVARFEGDTLLNSCTDWAVPKG